jgi:perosamine synthetase
MGSDEKNKAYEEYMCRVSKEKIAVYEPSLGVEELKNLEQVVKSNWISEGKYTREFEKLLALESERKFSLAFSNATSALITGMKSLGIGPESEVIVPTFAHSADTNAISATGAVPRFADVNENTLCLSTNTIDAVIDEKVKAVLFVCAYGNATGLIEIVDYCKNNSLLLVNDCAPALFGRINEKSIASFGDFSVLSFFADKTITTGEGGMLLTNNSNLVTDCNMYKHDGRKERGHELIERRGFNYRITEFQSAVGVAQFKKGPRFAQRKQEILNLYRIFLTDTPNTEVFNFNFNKEAVPHRVVLFVKDSESLIDHLVNEGIGARRLFRPMHSQPVYGMDHHFTNSQELYNHGLEVPTYPGLKDSQIKNICKVITKYMSR